MLADHELIKELLCTQHFIELLRAGGPSAQMKAIECSRTELGPCAMNAYPVRSFLSSFVTILLRAFKISSALRSHRHHTVVDVSWRVMLCLKIE